MLVCPRCFESKGLQARLVAIRPSLPDEDRCDFHPTMKGIPTPEVAKIIDPVFRENYAGGVYDSRLDEFAGAGLSEVLFDLTGADDDRVVQALIEELIEADDYWPGDGDEPFYSEDHGYQPERYALGQHGRLWSSFRQSLLHGQRFFNADARDLIERIFRDVHQQRDVDRQGPVYMIQPDELQATFFRARVADDEILRKEIARDVVTNLGPPPEGRRRPGRLNPSGIAAFYAAFDLDTCVAELRPSVGSVVVGAKFQITEPICVLDTTRFDAKPKEPNLFATGARERTAQWRFMQSFMREIAEPILPGNEHLAYIPTQAVAEYLVRHHRFKFAQQDRTIDAIIYGSAQHPEGKNIALLGDAAVAGWPVEDEGHAPADPKDPDDDFAPFGWTLEIPTPPRARITPVPDSLQVRRVRGVRFKTDEHDDLDIDPDEDYPVEGMDWRD